jgi:hypothetical protein
MRRNKNKKLRSCLQWGRLFRRKTLFREVDQGLLRNPRKEGQAHKLQGERKRTDTTSLGNQDISNENVLREGRGRI